MAYNPQLTEKLRYLRSIAKVHLSGESLAQFEKVCEEIHIELTKPHLTLEDLIQIYLEPIRSNLEKLEERYQNKESLLQTRIDIEHHYAQMVLLENIISHYKQLEEMTDDSDK